MVYWSNFDNSLSTIDYALLLEDLKKEKGKIYVEALELRWSGHTYKMIGKLLKIPSWKARRIIKEGIEILREWYLSE